MSSISSTTATPAQASIAASRGSLTRHGLTPPGAAASGAEAPCPRNCSHHCLGSANVRLPWYVKCLSLL